MVNRYTLFFSTLGNKIGIKSLKANSVSIIWSLKCENYDGELQF